ncbi:TPR repeat containing exported protein; Putative periplasmic protein contains a protein prenylyltransferase domain [hydrothermal vent metagenome]|uniref:TPR repeat containing exported protein Putative periplasmic protein contains a protein prenylyltransferase domain n=1 Tax=hydrothermal vent metagenome TaxID=652676 RepID=A0A1W1EIG5_9ZZZZ
MKLNKIILSVAILASFSYSNEADLRYRLSQQKERIDGLTRIVEGLGRTINELRQNRSGGRGSRYSDEELVNELGRIVDNINENYVSKAELKKAIENLANNYKNSTIDNSERIFNNSDDVIEIKDTPNERVVTPRVFEEDKRVNNIAKSSNSSKYISAVRLYNKKQYAKAKLIFKSLSKSSYKEGPTNYYLGEIAYFTKRYDDAIFYFKKSAGVLSKASYMHILLLHTAISLEKVGNKKEAKRFYQNIVDNYSNNSSVSIAKIRLDKLR